MFYPTTRLDELMPDILINTIYENYNTFKESFFGSIAETTLDPQVPAQTNETSISGEEDNMLNTSPVQHSDGTRGALPVNVLIHPSVSYSYKYGSIMLSGLDDNFTDTSDNTVPKP